MDCTPATSISDVDDQICRVLNGSPDTITSRLSSFEASFVHAPAGILARLMVLKDIYRRHPAVEDAYRTERDNNRTASRSPNPSYTYLQSFEAAFKTINEQCHHAFDEGKVGNFLDIGTAPGGFATWLLRANGKARGVGITLSPAASGIQEQIVAELHGRFHVQLEDVCRIANGQANIENASGLMFDLVIANAAITLPDKPTPWHRSTQLVLAELLVALTNIAPGGSLVISLRTRPFDWVVDMIGLLRQCFQNLTSTKPRYQCRRSFAYIVCQGFTGSLPNNSHCLVNRIRECMHYLEHADLDPNALQGGSQGMPRLSGVTLDIHREFVADLLEPVWNMQFEAIHRDLEKILNGNTRSSDDDSSDNGGAHTLRHATHASARSAADASPNWRQRQANPPSNYAGSAVPGPVLMYRSRAGSANSAGGAGLGANRASWRDGR